MEWQELKCVLAGCVPRSLCSGYPGWTAEVELGASLEILSYSVKGAPCEAGWSQIWYRPGGCLWVLHSGGTLLGCLELRQSWVRFPGVLCGVCAMVEQMELRQRCQPWVSGCCVIGVCWWDGWSLSQYKWLYSSVLHSGSTLQGLLEPRQAWVRVPEHSAQRWPWGDNWCWSWCELGGSGILHTRSALTCCLELKWYGPGVFQDTLHLCHFDKMTGTCSENCPGMSWWTQCWVYLCWIVGAIVGYRPGAYWGCRPARAPGLCSYLHYWCGREMQTMVFTSLCDPETVLEKAKFREISSYVFFQEFYGFMS